jgi:hypothetical protein
METKDDLRRELKDAIEKVRHQIEVQEATPSYVSSPGHSGNEVALAALRTELAELEEAWVGLAV